MESGIRQIELPVMNSMEDTVISNQRNRPVLATALFLISLPFLIMGAAGINSTFQYPSDGQAVFGYLLGFPLVSVGAALIWAGITALRPCNRKTVLVQGVLAFLVVLLLGCAFPYVFALVCPSSTAVH